MKNFSTTTTENKGFTFVTIGSVKFILNPNNLELGDMAKALGFDLQKRKVIDFEYEHDAIVEFLKSEKQPTIIQKSIFSKY